MRNFQENSVAKTEFRRPNSQICFISLQSFPITMDSVYSYPWFDNSNGFPVISEINDYPVEDSIYSLGQEESTIGSSMMLDHESQLYRTIDEH